MISKSEVSAYRESKGDLNIHVISQIFFSQDIVGPNQHAKKIPPQTWHCNHNHSIPNISYIYKRTDSIEDEHQVGAHPQNGFYSLTQKHFKISTSNLVC